MSDIALIDPLSNLGLSEPSSDSGNSLSVVPQLEDLDQEPALRKNRIRGEYETAQDYIDIQCRLLKEDYVRPIRSAVKQIRAGQEPVNRALLYRDLRIVSLGMNKKDGVVIVLRFNTDGAHFREMRWSAKRLMYGSLLCLSGDNFTNNVLFGVITESRYVSKDGVLEIKLLSEYQNVYFDNQYELGGSYTAIESTAYYEAYRHVLDALENSPLQDFPVAPHIIRCERETSAPDYMRSRDRFKFTSTNGTVITREATDPSNWPTEVELGLNTSQLAAFHSAITQRFSVIQGPPGTGKTYVSLKVVEWLLLNFYDGLLPNFRTLKKPILVVCYTNHALDQFLEGILKFCESQDVLRMGTRSKSKKLIPCLRENVRPPPNCSIASQKQGYYGSLSKIQDTCQAYHMNIGKSRVLWDDTPGFITNSTHADQLRQVGDELDDKRNAMLLWLSGWKKGERIPPFAEGSAVPQAGDRDSDEEREREYNVRFMVDDISEEQLVSQTASGATERVESYHSTENQNDTQRVMQEPTRHNASESHAFSNIWKIVTKQLNKTDTFTEEETNTVHDIWSLSGDYRWKLYRFWLRRFQYKYSELMKENRVRYENLLSNIRTLRDEDDLELFSRAKIVGMTTTAAARYQKVLEKVGPPIVIAEEAAEVLEGHLVASLSRHCQHLILIGDHKQLRPKPNDYELETRYNLGISLFERMVMNGVPYKTLDTQHRMRPEISKYVRPIYDIELKDSQTVYHREPIRGVDRPVFFLNHQYEESTAGLSKTNQFEAEMVTELVSHLLMQDYQCEDITVITMYSGQYRLLKRLLAQERCQDVRVSTVDDYQGEENKIIILSTVRSNHHGNAGFVKIENRICVCLSRAQYGLYVFGNIDMLEKASDLWRKLKRIAEDAGEIGSKLQLRCEQHRDDVIFVERAEDFRSKAPEGGCQRSCVQVLDCGHTCALKCHGYDRDHDEYRCKVPVIPHCGHDKQLVCCCEVDEYLCPEVISITLACGHQNQILCCERQTEEAAECSYKGCRQAIR